MLGNLAIRGNRSKHLPCTDHITSQLIPIPEIASFAKEI